MAKKQQTEAEWFAERIEAIFGRGAQSAFARFLDLEGAGRSHATLVRAINNYANGRAPLSSEMIALLTVLQEVPDDTHTAKMIRWAIDGTRQNF